MKKFDWRKFKQGYFSVRCRSFERASSFLKEAHDRGYTWINGEEINYSDTYTEDYSWYEYKYRTIYSFEKRGSQDKGLIFGDDKDIGEFEVIVDWVTNEEDKYTIEVVTPPKEPKFLSRCVDCYSSKSIEIKQTPKFVYRECTICGCQWRYNKLK